MPDPFGNETDEERRLREEEERRKKLGLEITLSKAGEKLPPTATQVPPTDLRLQPTRPTGGTRKAPTTIGLPPTDLTPQRKPPVFTPQKTKPLAPEKARDEGPAAPSIPLPDLTYQPPPRTPAKPKPEEDLRPPRTPPTSQRTQAEPPQAPARGGATLPPPTIPPRQAAEMPTREALQQPQRPPVRAPQLTVPQITAPNIPPPVGGAALAQASQQAQTLGSQIQQALTPPPVTQRPRTPSRRGGAALPPPTVSAPPPQTPVAQQPVPALPWAQQLQPLAAAAQGLRQATEQPLIMPPPPTPQPRQAAPPTGGAALPPPTVTPPQQRPEAQPLPIAEQLQALLPYAQGLRQASEQLTAPPTPAAAAPTPTRPQPQAPSGAALPPPAVPPPPQRAEAQPLPIAAQLEALLPYAEQLNRASQQLAMPQMGLPQPQPTGLPQPQPTAVGGASLPPPAVAPPAQRPPAEPLPIAGQLQAIAPYIQALNEAAAQLPSIPAAPQVGLPALNLPNINQVLQSGQAAVEGLQGLGSAALGALTPPPPAVPPPAAPGGAPGTATAMGALYSPQAVNAWKQAVADYWNSTALGQGINAMTGGEVTPEMARRLVPEGQSALGAAFSGVGPGATGTFVEPGAPPSPLAATLPPIGQMAGDFAQWWRENTPEAAVGGRGGRAVPFPRAVPGATPGEIGAQAVAMPPPTGPVTPEATGPGEIDKQAIARPPTEGPGEIDKQAIARPGEEEKPTPAEEPLEVDWDKVECGSAEWAQGFQAANGFSPWEGPNSPEENMGRNIAWFGNCDEAGLALTDYAGAPEGGGGWGGWGGFGGGGWGGFGGGGGGGWDRGDQEPPWWWVHQQRGI